jgi:preprotein translocase subunit SecE
MSDKAETGTGLGTPDRGPRSGSRRTGDKRPGRLKRVITFYKQVVAELRKVIWPTRHELLTYTSVVLVFVLFMVVIISAYDFLFSQGVLRVFGNG